jgi:hypothetical protein
MGRINLAIAYLKFGTDKRLFTLMLIIITITIDSQIGYIADFIPKQLSSSTGIAIFVTIAAIYIITQYFILDYTKRINKETKDRASHLHALQMAVSISQYTLMAIIILVSFQIVVMHEYNIITLYVTHAISYGLWIVILSLLAKAFFSWYRHSNKDIMVLILALSMIAYVINGIASLGSYSDMLTQQKQIVTPADVANFPEFSIESTGSQINIVSQIASSVAYVLTWIGTVKMLHPYIKKLGKIKFWFVMGVTMIYYLISFPLFVLGYFTPSGDANAMTNILIVSMGSLLSGIIFGAAFFSVARTLRKDSSLRKHMIIAAFGFVLFYIAGSTSVAQAAFPPYGIVSVSFIGLSCYMIYMGLYSAAVTVSQDTSLRVSIRNSVSEQSKFLHSMGTAHEKRHFRNLIMQT